MPLKIQKTEAEWQDLLQKKGAQPGAWAITRQHGTEPTFSGTHTSTKADGTYTCIC